MIQGVPYDAEVEYLESSGSSTYFNLADLGRNIIKSASDTLEVSLTGLLIAKYAWDKLCRCTSHAGANVMSVATYPEFSYGFGNIRTTSMIAGNKHNYRVYYGSTGGNSTLSVDGSVLLSSTSTLAVYGFADFCLFARPNGTEQIARGNRIYNVVVRVNNKVVLYLQPVRVGNVGYLYDRVTRRLFGNQGTGAFLYGLDVATPVMGLWRFRDITTTGGAA